MPPKIGGFGDMNQLVKCRLHQQAVGDTCVTANEKMKAAIEMRLEGKTYKEIGAAFGVSATRAKQIFDKAKRLEVRCAEWTDGLPTITANTLRRMGFNSKDEVAAAIDGKKILKMQRRDRFGVINEGIGKKGVEAINEWLTNS